MNYLIINYKIKIEHFIPYYIIIIIMEDIEDLDHLINTVCYPFKNSHYFTYQKEIITNALMHKTLDFLFEYLIEHKSDVLCINIGCCYHRDIYDKFDYGKTRFYNQFNIISGLIHKDDLDDDNKPFLTNYVLIDPNFMKYLTESIKIIYDYDLILDEKLDENIFKFKSNNKNYTSTYFQYCKLYKKREDKFTHLINTYLENGCVVINNSLKFFSLINITDHGFFFNNLNILLKNYINNNFKDHKHLILSEFNFNTNNFEILLPNKKILESNYIPIIIEKKGSNYEIIY